MSGRRALSRDDTVVPSSVTTTLKSVSTTDLHDRLDQRKSRIILEGNIHTKEG